MILVVVILTFLFYQSALSYYFISDDFLGFIPLKNLFELVIIDPYNNHYIPLIKTSVYVLTGLFAHNPFPYHLFVIIIHLVNVFLVYTLSKAFFHQRFKSILSALLFTFFFVNYEVVFWYGALNNSLLVTFYILSLLALIEFCKTRKTTFLLLFQLGFLCSFFIHEYALSLIGVGAFYWWLFTDKKKKREFFILFSFPLLIVMVTTILKAIIVQMPLVVRTPSLFKFIAFFMRSVTYLFIPNPYIVDRIPNFCIPFLFFIILIILVRYTKNKQALFLLLWAGATIVVYSLISAPQARYFYLSCIPVVLYVLLVANLKKGASIVYVFFILISGIVFLQNQKSYWKKSSEITQNVISTLNKQYIISPKMDVVYFVNLPDSSNDSLWKAYVFRAGFNNLLITFTPMRAKKTVFLRSFSPTPHTMDVPFMTPEKLQALAQKNIVFVYKEDLNTIVQLK